MRKRIKEKLRCSSIKERKMREYTKKKNQNKKKSARNSNGKESKAK